MRIRRSLVLMALVAAVLVAAQPASAGTSARALRWRVLNLVNTARSHRGVARLRLNASLSDSAGKHSIRMAKDGRLFHTSNISVVLSRYRLRVWGENVGMGPTPGAVHHAFMQSTEHRDNILNPRFHRIGVGVVRSHGSVWITQIFYG